MTPTAPGDTNLSDATEDNENNGAMVSKAINVP